MIKVDIWSDINCPFCYIGKRHLELALEKFAHRDQVQVEWKSFELDPEANPPKGASNTELLARKYGRDIQWAKEMNNNLTEMAALAGLDFHMDQVVPANSFNAHRLLHLAKFHQLQNEMEEKLFMANFVEGKDIGDPQILQSLAFDLGLDREEVIALFSNDRFAKEVREDEQMAARLGIRGVPFFIFNQSTGLSGAHPVETFLEILQKSDQPQTSL